MHSLYESLGVPPDADAGLIRRAYLEQARRHHPDHHAGDPPAALEVAENRMRELNEAWAVLSDPAKRAAYDRAIGRPQALAGAASAPTSTGSGRGRRAGRRRGRSRRDVRVAVGGGTPLSSICMVVAMMCLAGGFLVDHDLLVLAGLGAAILAAASFVVAGRRPQGARRASGAEGPRGAGGLGGDPSSAARG